MLNRKIKEVTSTQHLDLTVNFARHQETERLKKKNKTPNAFVKQAVEINEETRVKV